MDIVLLQFALQIRDIELISIKVDQIAVRGGKSRKSVQYIDFVLVVGGKPLNGMPACGFAGAFVKISTADHIEIGTVHVQTGCFYIDKQCLVWNTEIFNRVFWG